MTNIYEQSIALHKKIGGKIELANKVAIDDKETLALVYSPGVAGPCRAIAADPSRAHELTLKKNTVAIISDGTAVLGLGDIGPLAGIPVMEGKAALFKRFAGVDAFPLCLDTTDVDEIIETVKRIAPVFGGINLEDISAPRCFEIEARLRAELDIPVMHDDQHGTAIVVLAGLINAWRVAGKDPQKARVVINGMGAAGVAITRLIKKFAPGMCIIAVDSTGIIGTQRTDLNATKQSLLDDHIIHDGEDGDLMHAMTHADVFIGVSQAGLVTQDHVRQMNTDPIIFAMANPEPEIMPDDAHAAGALIVATGRSDFPNQVNNVLAFPGLFKGILGTGKQFESETFVRAAHAIAEAVESPTAQYIIPDPFDERIPELVARAVRHEV